MSQDATIGRIARTDYLQLAPTTPIRETVAMFARHGVSAALVVDDAAGLVGILTEKDCFRPMLNASYYQQWTGCVADYMSRAVRSLPDDLDLVAAAEEFLAHSHRVYPVTRGTEVVGMLHRPDLLAAILALSEGAGSAAAGEPGA